MMTVKQAAAKNVCPTCNFAGRHPKQNKPCDYHHHPTMNYRNVAPGFCALKDEEVEQRKREYGTLPGGRLNVKPIK